MNRPLTAVEMTCRHCGRQIIPTTFGTWQDKDNLGYEVCDLMDETGPDHEPVLPTDTAVTVVQTSDGINTTDPEDGDTERVTCFDVVRNGEVLVSLQVTRIDIAVFAVSTDVGVIDRRTDG